VEKGNEAGGGTAVQQTPGAGAGGAGAGSTTDPGTGTGTGPGTDPAPTAGQGSGGQQADQSGPGGWTDHWTDEELVEAADHWKYESEIMQRRIDAAIESGASSETLQELRDRQDTLRRRTRAHEQTLHEREMARPATPEATAPDAPEGPSAEAQHPGGSRTGVDAEGRGYEVDSEGQRTERDRFDQFRPGSDS